MESSASEKGLLLSQAYVIELLNNVNLLDEPKRYVTSCCPNFYEKNTIRPDKILFPLKNQQKKPPYATHTLTREWALRPQGNPATFLKKILMAWPGKKIYNSNVLDNFVILKIFQGSVIFMFD